MMRGLILFLSSYLALSCFAQAQSFYVAKTGSDSNNGSQSAPWPHHQSRGNRSKSGQHSLRRRRNL